MIINKNSYYRILRSVIEEIINYETSSSEISSAVNLATRDYLQEEITSLVKRNLLINRKQTLEAERWITGSTNFDDPDREVSQRELDDDREEIKTKAAHLASYAYSFLDEHNELPVFHDAGDNMRSAIVGLLCEKFHLSHKDEAGDEYSEKYNSVLLSLLNVGDFKIIKNKHTRDKSIEVFDDDSDIPF